MKFKNVLPHNNPYHSLTEREFVAANGRARGGSVVSYMSGGSDEEVGLRLATLFHVQDRDLLGDSGPTMGCQGQFRVCLLSCLFG